MRESILARLARFTVRSCLKPALQPTFPVPVQRCWANIATRTLSVPVGVRFSQSSLGDVPTCARQIKRRVGWRGIVLARRGLHDRFAGQPSQHHRPPRQLNWCDHFRARLSAVCVPKS
jgi:hypothetical protein